MHINLTVLTINAGRRVLKFEFGFTIIKGAYIKYVGGGLEGFTNVSNAFCCPGDHRPKFFMAQ